MSEKTRQYQLACAALTDAPGVNTLAKLGFRASTAGWVLRSWLPKQENNDTLIYASCQRTLAPLSCGSHPP
jgi:hypothetical protein